LIAENKVLDNNFNYTKEWLEAFEKYKKEIEKR
jgi:hypothetical protein